MLVMHLWPQILDNFIVSLVNLKNMGTTVHISWYVLNLVYFWHAIKFAAATYAPKEP